MRENSLNEPRREGKNSLLAYGYAGEIERIEYHREFSTRIIELNFPFLSSSPQSFFFFFLIISCTSDNNDTREKNRTKENNRERPLKRIIIFTTPRNERAIRRSAGNVKFRNCAIFRSSAFPELVRNRTKSGSSRANSTSAAFRFRVMSGFDIKAFLSESSEHKPGIGSSAYGQQLIIQHQKLSPCSIPSMEGQQEEFYAICDFPTQTSIFFFFF